MAYTMRPATSAGFIAYEFSILAMSFMSVPAGGGISATAGALRVELKIWVSTNSGHRQVTFTLVPSSSIESDSESPTIAYLDTW